MGISKTTKTYAERYKTDCSVTQTSNTGFDSTTRVICSGDGADSSLSLSDDVLSVQPVNDNTTGTMLVKNQGGSNILTVDTTNSKVLTGASQVSANTQFKEMGLYDFSPTAGYHYPLIANTMHFESAYAADNDWGNGTDPATTLDVSGLTAQENAVAVYWYIENDITLDSVRHISTADGSATLNFHLLAYTLDTSTNHGDLSSGVVHASGIVAATATTIRTNTLTLNSADIDADKVVVGFVENATDTSDVSVSFQIKYHIR
jgi:hypothetical protein